LGAAGAALPLVALLAGCGGQQTKQTASRGGAVTHGGYYNRPASYAPPGPANARKGYHTRDPVASGREAPPVARLTDLLA